MEIVLDLYGFEKTIDINSYTYRNGKFLVCLVPDLRTIVCELSEIPEKDIKCNQIAFYKNSDGKWRPNYD